MAGHLESQDTRKFPVDYGEETILRVDRVSKEPNEVIGVPEADAELLGESIESNAQRVVHVLSGNAFDDLYVRSGHRAASLTPDAKGRGIFDQLTSALRQSST